MRYRFMRVIVFFDLPMVSKEDIRRYSKFHKYLILQGFIMLQKSVYSKIALNNTSAAAITSNLRNNKPLSGIIQILTITEKQFQSIEYLIGEKQNEIIDTQQRLVII